MDLIRVEEKQLIIADEIISKIKELEIKRKLIDKKEKEFKDQLVEILEKNKVDNSLSFESNDKTLKISYIPGGETSTFSSKALYEKEPDIWRKYLVPSKRKGSIRITVREDKKEKSNE